MREALRTLRGEGMVQLEPHRGHVVVPLTRGDIEDIFWLQATIAKELAATAAERITDAQIEELERLNDETRGGRRSRRSRGGRQRRSSRSTGRSTVRPAGSSWPGSCCTSRGTCRGRSMPAMRRGVPRRWPATAS